MPSASQIGDDERRPLLSSYSSPATSHCSSPGPVTKASSSSSSSSSSSPAVVSASFSCRRCLSTYVPIEPLLFGYAFARIVVVVLTGFYFYDQASHMYGDPSMSSLNPCGRNASGGRADRERAENVQKESLQLTMVGSFSVYMTALLPALFLGPLTDRVGRRPGFVLPLLGVVSRAIAFLMVLGTGASVYFVYIGTVLEGLGGGFGAFYMTAFSTAADITMPGHQRALRICIIEALLVFGSALATFIAGQWRRRSYTEPVMLAAAVGVVSLIFALWGMPETHGSSSSGGAPSGTEQRGSGSVREGQDGESGEGEEEPLLAGKSRGESSRQARGGEEASEDGGGASVSGRGRGGAVRKYAAINSDPPVDGGGAHPGPRGTDGCTDEGGAGTVAISSHNYISFSPTGHRLSNPGRFHGSQRQHSSSGRGLRDDVIPESYSSPPSQAPTDSSSPRECVECCALALRNIRKSWGVYFRSDDTSHPERRCVLGLCFVCFLLTVAVNFSKPGVETVYRLGELCWNAVQESEFDSGWLVQHWLFIFMVLHVLQGRLKMRNVSMAMVGCVSAICAPLVFSLATLPEISARTANILVFVSAGSGTLARCLIPMLRSMSSAVVSLDEQGALFAGYACVELAGAAVFDLAASQVYKVTVHVWKGIIFVIMTLFFVVVMILLIILSVVQRRAHRNNSHHATGRTSALSQDTAGSE